MRILTLARKLCKINKTVESVVIGAMVTVQKSREERLQKLGQACIKSAAHYTIQWGFQNSFCADQNEFGD